MFENAYKWLYLLSFHSLWKFHIKIIVPTAAFSFYENTRRIHCNINLGPSGNSITKFKTSLTAGGMAAPVLVDTPPMLSFLCFCFRNNRVLGSTSLSLSEDSCMVVIKGILRELMALIQGSRQKIIQRILFKVYPLFYSGARSEKSH